MFKTFKQIFKKIISETNVSGGADSVFGAGIVATASPVSGDTYAPRDARVPKILGKGITRRYFPTDLIASKHKKKKIKH
jgi:hypothetical protein